MTKLKPCPFCGGEAHMMKMGYPHWIYCLNCGAKVHGGTTDERDSIKAWNRRADLYVGGVGGRYYKAPNSIEEVIVEGEKDATN